jgi:hypothetical protein
MCVSPDFTAIGPQLLLRRAFPFVLAILAHITATISNIPANVATIRANVSSVCPDLLAVCTQLPAFAWIDPTLS